jgi:hypothetical protein
VSAIERLRVVWVLPLAAARILRLIETAPTRDALALAIAPLIDKGHPIHTQITSSDIDFLRKEYVRCRARLVV